jgi:hypothetical protein
VVALVRQLVERLGREVGLFGQTIVLASWSTRSFANSAGSSMGTNMGPTGTTSG